LGISVGLVGIFGPMEQNILARIISIVLGIICLTFAGLTVLIVTKGVMKLRIYLTVIASMIFASLVVMLAGAMGKGIRREEPIWAMQVVTYGIVFLLVSSLLMILNHLQQSEYRTREKLLEIECRLVDLVDKLEGKQSKQ
jgi:hypothetical protein